MQLLRNPKLTLDADRIFFAEQYQHTADLIFLQLSFLFYKYRIIIYYTRRTKEGSMKRLPDSELEIMMILWQLEAPVQRDMIEEKLKEIHPIALTTLLTLLTRLSDKGFLEIRKNGRRSEYIPLIAKKDYQREASRNFIAQIFGGSMSAFASALNDNAISKEDLKELKRMLDEGEL